MARAGWGDGPVIDIGGPRLPPFGRGGMPSLAALRAIALLLLGGLLLLTTYYQVEPDQVGVVQRFGAFVRTTDPGPHLKWRRRSRRCPCSVN